MIMPRIVIECAARLPSLSAQQARNQRAGERRQRNDQIELLHADHDCLVLSSGTGARAAWHPCRAPERWASGHPFRLSKSSTSMVFRLRKSTTSIAEPDRRLGGRDGQYEKHENLTGRIVEIMRERDEVHVDREQHQLDRHQQDDDVLAIQEDSDHAESEQDRASTR
jgi:hypothetical protein